MGIQGLLKALDPVLAKGVHVKKFRGKTVAIDGFAWLHRGLYACPIEAAKGIASPLGLNFFMRRIRMLRHHGVKPLVVLDGGRPAPKAETDKARSEKRKEVMTRGFEMLADAELFEGQERQARIQLAREQFQRAVQVPKGMVTMLMQVLKRENIPFIVAPYEADAQLVYLLRHGHAAAAITEDSDLITFCVAAGVTASVLYKMDDHGLTEEIKTQPPSEWAAQATAAAREVNRVRRARVEGKATPEERARVFPQAGLGSGSMTTFLRQLAGVSPRVFVQACVLGGCDYLESLPRIGLVTALKLVRKYKTAYDAVRVQRVLHQIHFKGTTAIPDGYLKRATQAELCFYHQRVYDPTSACIVTLTPLPSPLPEYPDESWKAFAKPRHLQHSMSVPAIKLHAQSTPSTPLLARTGTVLHVPAGAPVLPPEGPEDITSFSDEEDEECKIGALAHNPTLARSVSAPAAPVGESSATAAPGKPTQQEGEASKEEEEEAPKAKRKAPRKGTILSMFAKLPKPKVVKTKAVTPPAAPAAPAPQEDSDEAWAFVGKVVASKHVAAIVHGRVHPVTLAPYKFAPLDPDVNWAALGVPGKAVMKHRGKYSGRGVGSGGGGGSSGGARSWRSSSSFSSTSKSVASSSHFSATSSAFSFSSAPQQLPTKRRPRPDAAPAPPKRRPLAKAQDVADVLSSYGYSASAPRRQPSTSPRKRSRHHKRSSGALTAVLKSHTAANDRDRPARRPPSLFSVTSSGSPARNEADHDVLAALSKSESPSPPAAAQDSAASAPSSMAVVVDSDSDSDGSDVVMVPGHEGEAASPPRPHSGRTNDEPASADKPSPQSTTYVDASPTTLALAAAAAVSPVSSRAASKDTAAPPLAVTVVHNKPAAGTQQGATKRKAQTQSRAKLLKAAGVKLRRANKKPRTLLSFFAKKTKATNTK